MPSRAKRQRSTQVRNAARARTGERFRDLAAVEARRAELVAAAAAAAAQRRRALAGDDEDAAAAATDALVAAAGELAAGGIGSELAALVGVPLDELRRLLRSARGRSGDG